MLSATLSGGIDFEALRKFCRNREAEILVGFPAGRMHIDSTHELDRKKNGDVKTDRYGNPKRKGGNKVTQETAELAKELHFGSQRTPARPFLTDGISQNKQKLKQVLETECEKDQPNWHKVGTTAVGAIQEFVRGDYYKTHIPNSATTIEKKGSDMPLIDGGDLLNSLTFLVDGKEDEALQQRHEAHQEQIANDYGFDTYGGEIF